MSLGFDADTAFAISGGAPAGVALTNNLDGTSSDLGSNNEAYSTTQIATGTTVVTIQATDNHEYQQEGQLQVQQLPLRHQPV